MFLCLNWIHDVRTSPGKSWVESSMGVTSHVRPNAATCPGQKKSEGHKRKGRLKIRTFRVVAYAGQWKKTLMEGVLITKLTNRGSSLSRYTQVPTHNYFEWHKYVMYLYYWYVENMLYSLHDSVARYTNVKGRLQHVHRLRDLVGYVI